MNTTEPRREREGIIFFCVPSLEINYIKILENIRYLSQIKSIYLFVLWAVCHESALHSFLQVMNNCYGVTQKKRNSPKSPLRLCTWITRHTPIFLFIPLFIFYFIVDITNWEQGIYGGAGCFKHNCYILDKSQEEKS